ncbi:MAG TPA: hypothetical protein PKG95_09440 [Anaerolineaceae bacterium]|nr:hypothetical protein [Anaerolineaceae bacterium]
MKKTLADWLGTFWGVLHAPTRQTFLDEAQKAPGKFLSALLWVVFAVMVDALGTTLVNGYPLSIGTFGIIFIFAPIGFLCFVFCLDAMNRKIYGASKSRYDEFLYLITALFVPFMLLTFLLSLIPVAGAYLAWVIWLYPIFLLVQVIRALTRLKPAQAIILTALSILLGGTGAVCLPIFLLSLAGLPPSAFGQ